MKILFTGGLGFIGSHTAVTLLENGYDVIIVDNLSNSKEDTLKKIEKITGKSAKFYNIDICNRQDFEKVFAENKDIFAVIHFAGYKAVGESVKEPLKYYENNMISTFNLLELMKKYNVKNAIYSSSATVYEPAKVMPIDESYPLGATNPYGRTKLFNEYVFKDFWNANKDFNITMLRYFNPIGAHSSGLLGEDPNGIPNNLMPYICKVATGKLDSLKIFGNDYKTKDGTGVRDYIHIMDLADGHLKALNQIEKNQNNGLKIYNLGTGKGYSVLDIVKTFNKVNGNLVKYKFVPRRSGDIDECYASAKKAENELGFKATRTLEDMCRSSYLYELNNLDDKNLLNNKK